MFFNFGLFFPSALALLAIATIAAAEPVPAEKRQIDSFISSLTGDAGSLTNDVVSGWTGATSYLGSLGDGVYGTLTSVGGSVYTVLSSEGGNAVTLAGNLPGTITSFAGEQVTILTSAVGGALPTQTGNGNSALPRNSFTLLDVGLALGGVALGALITFA